MSPNVLEQDVSADGQSKKYPPVNASIHLSLTGQDLSYFYTREGWLYLAGILDLYAAASLAGLYAIA